VSRWTAADDASGDGDEERDRKRRTGQRQRRRQSIGDQFRDGSVVVIRLPEVTPHPVCQPIQVLDRYRIVEAVLRAKLRDLLVGRVALELLAEHRLGGVPRREEDHAVGGKRDPREDEQSHHGPFEQVALHYRSSVVQSVMWGMAWRSGPSIAPRVPRTYSL